MNGIKMSGALVLGFSLAAFGSLLAQTSSLLQEPIVGIWRMHVQGGAIGIMDCNQGGAVKSTFAEGRWVSKSSAGIEHKYQLTYTTGFPHIDEITVSADRQKYDGKNNKGGKFWAERIPSRLPDDPIIGKWVATNEGKEGLLDYRADGTVGNDGGWTAMWIKKPALPRRYEVIWAGGRYVDDVTLTEDGQRYNARNNIGASISGVRSDAAQSSQPASVTRDIPQSNPNPATQTPATQTQKRPNYFGNSV